MPKEWPFAATRLGALGARLIGSNCSGGIMKSVYFLAAASLVQAPPLPANP